MRPDLASPRGDLEMLMASTMGRKTKTKLLRVVIELTATAMVLSLFARSLAFK